MLQKHPLVFEKKTVVEATVVAAVVMADARLVVKVYVAAAVVGAVVVADVEHCKIGESWVFGHSQREPMTVSETWERYTVRLVAVSVALVPCIPNHCRE